MNRIQHLGIGTRLAGGFGLLLALVALTLGLSALRFGELGATLDRIVTEDWSQARAVATVDALTRANARRTMELLLVGDAAQAGATRGHIRQNKAHIDEALATLDRLVHRAEGQAALTALKAQRALYVASFTQVDRLVAA